MIVYCKAYPPDRVAEYPAAAEALAARASRPEIVYLWSDFTVTSAPFPDHDVLLAGGTDPGWAEFCTERLGFAGGPR